jgi:hypothetical protein
MRQLTYFVLKSKTDKTKVSLIFEEVGQTETACFSDNNYIFVKSYGNLFRIITKIIMLIITTVTLFVK